MDMRTGETYPSLEEALAAGVPESDIALVEQKPGQPPRVTFPKHKPFASLRNRDDAAVERMYFSEVSDPNSFDPVTAGEQHGN